MRALELLVCTSGSCTSKDTRRSAKTIGPTGSNAMVFGWVYRLTVALRNCRSRQSDRLGAVGKSSAVATRMPRTAIPRSAGSRPGPAPPCAGRADRETSCAVRRTRGQSARWRPADRRTDAVEWGQSAPAKHASVRAQRTGSFLTTRCSLPSSSVRSLSTCRSTFIRMPPCERRWHSTTTIWTTNGSAGS